MSITFVWHNVGHVTDAESTVFKQSSVAQLDPAVLKKGSAPLAKAFMCSYFSEIKFIRPPEKAGNYLNIR